MAEKKITRKVIKPVGKPAEVKKVVAKKEPSQPTQPAVIEESDIKVKTKKGCYFCQNNSTPSYTDLTNLKRFLTDRAKIVSKERSGVCSKHQRQVAKNIKYGRHLGLLPFVPKV